MQPTPDQEMPSELWMLWYVDNESDGWFVSSTEDHPSSEGIEATAYLVAFTQEEAIKLAAEVNRHCLESPDYCYPVRVK